MCFPVSIVKFLRTPFSQNDCERTNASNNTMKTHQRLWKVIEIKDPYPYTLRVISSQETTKSNTNNNRSIYKKRETA